METIEKDLNMYQLKWMIVIPCSISVIITSLILRLPGLRLPSSTRAISLRDTLNLATNLLPGGVRG
jgi:hypothetical protein